MVEALVTREYDSCFVHGPYREILVMKSTVTSFADFIHKMEWENRHLNPLLQIQYLPCLKKA